MAQRKRGSGKGTGKARSSGSTSSGAPHPAVIGGVLAALVGLLIAAIVIASGGGSSPPAEPALEAPPVATAPAEPLAPATPAAPARPEPPAPEPAASEAPTAAPAAPERRGSAFGQATTQITGPSEQVHVARVVDGDTLELSDGRKIRLLGINTPERDRPLYREASQTLRELVDGKDVTLELDEEERDRYGRVLGYIHLGELFVNAEIVRQGMAYAFVWPTNNAHTPDFLAYQQEARMKRVGLWSLPAPDPAPLYIGNRAAPYFHREGCDRIKRLKGRNRVEFKTREEAFDAGMNPCFDCKS